MSGNWQEPQKQRLERQTGGKVAGKGLNLKNGKMGALLQEYET